MQFGIALKALVIWGTILILAILNGGLREAILIPKLGTVAGNIMSGVFGVGADFNGCLSFLAVS